MFPFLQEGILLFLLLLFFSVVVVVVHQFELNSPFIHGDSFPAYLVTTRAVLPSRKRSAQGKHDDEVFVKSETT